MKNSQKGFVPLILIIIIAVLAVGAGAVIYYQSKQKVTSQPSSNSAAQQQTSPIQLESKEYRNALFGYQLTYPNGWRVAENYTSAYYAAVHQTTTFPGIENSEIVVFTDLNLNDEQSYLAINEGERLPRGHSIQIFPSYLEPILKNHPADEKNKLILQILTLTDGSQAGLTDERQVVDSGRLSIYIPHSREFVVNSGALGSSLMKSLVIQTDGITDSEAERALHDIFNSLTFK